MKYTVCIVERSFTDVDVEADNQEQAEALALAKWEDMETYDHITDVDVHSVECHDTNTMTMK